MEKLHHKRSLSTSLQPLLKTLNAVVARNFGKALVSFFVMVLGEALCIYLLVSPLYAQIGALNSAAAGASLSSLIMATVVLFASFMIWALFQYGFAVLLLRMVRGEYVTLGYVFYGWRTLSRSLKSALFVAFVGVVLTAAFVFALLYFTDVPERLIMAQRALLSGKTAPETATGAVRIDFAALSVFVLSALVTLIVYLQFAFLFQAAYDDKKGSLWGALKTNVRLLRRNKLRLLCLFLKAGGRFLVIALFAMALDGLLSFTTKANELTAVKLLLNFLYLVNGYTTLLRMYFALPVLYEEARAPQIDVVISDDADALSEREKDSAVIAETIALLEHDTAPSDAASGTDNAVTDSADADRSE